MEVFLGSVKVVLNFLAGGYTAESVMSNLPLRQVLEALFKAKTKRDYSTLQEVTKEYALMHPIELEFFIKLSNKLKNRVFRQKEEATVEERLDQLVDLGFAERFTTSTDPATGKKQKSETMYYQITDKGDMAMRTVVARRK